MKTMTLTLLLAAAVLSGCAGANPGVFQDNSGKVKFERRIPSK